MKGVHRVKTETVPERAKTHIPLYRVLLHNDDANSMDHVVRTLMRVFRFEQTECERIMFEAHQNGIALCVVEPFEQAELHRDQLRSSSLVSTIEPA
jgi:ATP-dependent Clp protease adaptor protein ClpS